MKKLIIILALLTALFCMEGVIGVAANIRTAPSAKAEIAVDSITVEVIDTYSVYYEVMFVAGTDHANDGETYTIWSKNTEERGGKYYVTGKGVAVRDKWGKKIKKPDGTFKSAKPGAEFKIIDPLVDWYKVRLPNGDEGWIYKTTIRIIK